MGGEYLDEMYGFTHAAARVGVPMLQGGDSIAVSNPNAYREAWSNEEDPERWQPYLLHYCSGEYQYKGWKFHKKFVTRPLSGSENTIPGIMECNALPLQEPPPPPDSEAEPVRKNRMVAW